MTLDGFCDHTAGIADDEVHEHYNELIRNAGAIIWGRKTYQLMESYWPTVVENPTGNDSIDAFAVLIDNISKVVFSRTLKEVTWKNARLATQNVEDEILALKKQQGRDIYVGSPSLIVEAAKLNLIDEYQLNIQPIILGRGLTLFKDMSDRIDLKLVKTKTFGCGAVIHYYSEPKRNS